MSSAKILRVNYFHATVWDRPGVAYELLQRLASAGVNLLAFSAYPAGADRTNMVLFAENVELLARKADSLGMDLAGPEPGFLIQGDDELGALVEIHRKLSDAGINIYASSGVTSSTGAFGYTLSVKPDDLEEASRVLGI